MMNALNSLPLAATLTVGPSIECLRSLDLLIRKYFRRSLRQWRQHAPAGKAARFIEIVDCLQESRQHRKSNAELEELTAPRQATTGQQQPVTVRSQLSLKRSSVVATTGIAAEVEMNNNAPTTDEKCKGGLCGELSQLTDRFLIDQRNPY
jgi:hypothetical protein